MSVSVVFLKGVSEVGFTVQGHMMMIRGLGFDLGLGLGFRVGQGTLLNMSESRIHSTRS